MTALADLTDWKIDIANRNLVFSSPGIYEVITGKDVTAQNIAIDLIYNRAVSRLLADNPGSVETTLANIAGWVEEDPFIINGTAVASIVYFSEHSRKLQITAKVKDSAEINLTLAI